MNIESIPNAEQLDLNTSYMHELYKVDALWANTRLESLAPASELI
jgi:hypothetical protein